MKTLNATAIAATVWALAATMPAAAHHSGAMFDSSRSQTLVGTITEFNWTNPHASFKIEVPDATGKPVVWAIEMNGPQNLMHAGWRRSTIKPGDKVTTVVRPLRDGKPGGSIVSITLPDGRTLGGTGPGGNGANDYPSTGGAAP